MRFFLFTFGPLAWIPPASTRPGEKWFACLWSFQEWWQCKEMVDQRPCELAGEGGRPWGGERRAVLPGQGAPAQGVPRGTRSLLWLLPGKWSLSIFRLLDPMAFLLLSLCLSQAAADIGLKYTVVLPAYAWFVCLVRVPSRQTRATSRWLNLVLLYRPCLIS